RGAGVAQDGSRLDARRSNPRPATTPAPNAVTAMTTGALTAATMNGTTKSRTGLARASVGGAAVVPGRRDMAAGRMSRRGKVRESGSTRTVARATRRAQLLERGGCSHECDDFVTLPALTRPLRLIAWHACRSRGGCGWGELRYSSRR